jgi:hypothetical protein
LNQPERPPEQSDSAAATVCTTLNYILRKTSWKIPIDTGFLKIGHFPVTGCLEAIFPSIMENPGKARDDSR